MQFTVRMRISGDLLGLARILRLLKRHGVTEVRDRGAFAGPAELDGIVESESYPAGLARALSRQPNIVDAQIEAA
jgi:hypothetical protein